MPEESIIRIIVEGGSGPNLDGPRGSGGSGPLNRVVDKISLSGLGSVAGGLGVGGAAGAFGSAGLDRAFMIPSGSFDAIRTANAGKKLIDSGTGVNPYWVGGLDPDFGGSVVFNKNPDWGTPFKTPSQVETIVGWGAKGSNGKGVFFYKNYGDIGRLRKYGEGIEYTVSGKRGGRFFQKPSTAKFEQWYDPKTTPPHIQSIIDNIIKGSESQGFTGFFNRPGRVAGGTRFSPSGGGWHFPNSSAYSTGGIINGGYQLNKATQAGLRAVTTPSVGSSMRLLRAGGIAGGGLAIALGISAYINNARQDAVMTAAAEGRDATGGEVLRSVHDKITSHIDGVGSFFQKAIAGIASAPGKLVGNFGIGWAALSGDGSAAADFNKYAEDVDEYWSEAIGLKSTRQKRWAASKKFNEVRDHTKWLASEQTELAIRRNAESFADSYIHLGIATHNELRTLYESEMTTRIREKYSKQAMDEFDKTHNRTTFIRAQLASQGD